MIQPINYSWLKNIGRKMAIFRQGRKSSHKLWNRHGIALVSLVSPWPGRFYSLGAKWGHFLCKKSQNRLNSLSSQFWVPPGLNFHMQLAESLFLFSNSQKINLNGHFPFFVRFLSSNAYIFNFCLLTGKSYEKITLQDHKLAKSSMPPPGMTYID